MWPGLSLVTPLFIRGGFLLEPTLQNPPFAVRGSPRRGGQGAVRAGYVVPPPAVGVREVSGSQPQRPPRPHSAPEPAVSPLGIYTGGFQDGILRSFCPARWKEWVLCLASLRGRDMDFMVSSSKATKSGVSKDPASRTFSGASTGVS